MTHIVITDSREAYLKNKRYFESYKEAFEYYKKFDFCVNIVILSEFEAAVNGEGANLMNDYIIFISIPPYSEEAKDNIKEESKQLTEVPFEYL